MTRTVIRFALPVTSAALCLALAACGEEAERSANDDRAAGGEVLEGTISDDMIPLDQLRSQGDAADPAALENPEVDGEDSAAAQSGDTEPPAQSPEPD